MLLRGYFDGEVVHVMNPVQLELNQTVYITVPDADFTPEEEERILRIVNASDERAPKEIGGPK